MARKDTNELNVEINLQPNKISLKEAEQMVGQLGKKFEQMLSLRPIMPMTDLRKAQSNAAAVGRRILRTEQQILNTKNRARSAMDDEMKFRKKLTDNALKKDQAYSDLKTRLNRVDEKYGDNLSAADAKRRSDEISGIKKAHDEKIKTIDAEAAKLNDSIKESQLKQQQLEARAKVEQERRNALTPAALHAARRTEEERRKANLSPADIIKENENRRERQQRMAKKILGLGIAKTESESLEIAKRRIPLLKQETTLGKKVDALNRKGFKFRRMEYMDRRKEIEESYKMARRSGAMGGIEAFLGKRKDISKLQKETGAVSMGGAMKAGAGAIKGPMGAMMGAMGELAGPLLAVAGIAGALKLFMDIDEQVKKSYKSLFKFQAQGAEGWTAMNKGTMTSLGDLQEWRKKFDDSFDKMGIKFEDAIGNIGALTQAGIPLSKVLENDIKLFKDVNDMAITSGVSFEEASSLAGTLFTEFRKDTKSLDKTFVRLRDDAADSGMVTQKFYENVMNAAQGAAIYGGSIDDVSHAFAGLVKGMKMPQREAARLAQGVMDMQQTMSGESAALLGNLTDLTKPNKVAFDNLIDSVKELEPEVKRAIKARKMFNDKELISHDELLKIKDKETRDRAEQMSRVLSASYKDDITKQRALMRTLQKGDFLKSMIKAIQSEAPQLFEGVDMRDSKAVAKAILKSQFAIENISGSLSLSSEQIEFFRQELEKFGSNVDKYTGIFKASTKNEDNARKLTLDLFEEIKSGQKGRKSGEKKIAALLESSGAKQGSILKSLSEQTGLNLQLSDGADKNAEMIAGAIADDAKDFGDITKRQKDEEIQAQRARAREQSKIIIDGTKPIKDEITETIGYWLREIYDGVMKLYNIVKPWVEKLLFGSDRDSINAFEEATKQLSEFNNEKASLRKKLEPLREKRDQGKLSAAEQKELDEGEKNLKFLSDKAIEASENAKNTALFNDKSWWERRFSSSPTESIESTKRLSKVVDDLKKSPGSIDAAKKTDQEQRDAADLEEQRSRDYEMQRLKNSAFGFGISPMGGYPPLFPSTKHSSGGFTGQGARNEPAGIVHRGEYVVPADKVKRIGLSSLIRQIDDASRNINSSMSGLGPMATVNPMMLMREIDRSLGGTQASQSTDNSKNDRTYDNRQFIFHVNQKDVREIEQIVRKVIYSSKEGH